MVKTMDGSMGANGTAEIVSVVLRISNDGGRTGQTRLYGLRRPPDLSPDESPADWAEWNREVHRIARYSLQSFARSAPGGSSQADGYYWQDHEGGSTSRFDGEPSLADLSLGTSQHVQQGEVHGGN